MTYNNIRFLLVACLVFLGLCSIALPDPALALFEDIRKQSGALAGEQGAQFSLTDDPRLVVARGISVVTSLLGLLFFVYMVYGGSLILFSRGEKEQVTKGKATIVTGVIGVLIMLTAYTVTQFVSNALLYSTGMDGCDDTICVDVDPLDQNPDPLAPTHDPKHTIWNVLR